METIICIYIYVYIIQMSWQDSVRGWQIDLRDDNEIRNAFKEYNNTGNQSCCYNIKSHLAILRLDTHFMKSVGDSFPDDSNKNAFIIRYKNILKVMGYATMPSVKQFETFFDKVNEP